ncbi:MAG TPA: hypothetical protein PLE30_10900 [Candidatus Kapabacteria bacterium]|nr:hypothetical protein [Candidatus Kapabacteria bacterium]
MYSASFADDSHLRLLGGHGSGGGGGGRSLGSTQGFGPKTYDPYKLLSPNGNGVNVKSQANYARDIFGVIDFSQQVEKSNSTYSDFYNNPSKYEINPITGEPTGFGAIHPGDDPMYDAILFFADTKATELVIMGVKQLAPKVMATVSSIFLKGAERGLYNFSIKAASHMADPARFVPVQILDLAIKYGTSVTDTRGSRAILYSIELFKNGKKYNLEVLYDKVTNSIWHFQYSLIKP